MPPRKKSSFENFFSLKRHRRRLSRIAVNAPKAEFSVLKEQIVDAGKPNQTRGSHDDLDRHFESLHSEFSGQSALILEHARLNVLLRRQISPKETYARLAELYRSEAPYLLEHLNVRWMVSACDSIADWDPDPAARATALSVSLLVNTVKMIESERYLNNQISQDMQPDRMAHVNEALVPLFEGLSAFTVGTDDTLRNMRWRMEAGKGTHFSGDILMEVFDRLQVNDTVYARFRARHHRKKTSWW
jgi:hypothetical protein|tara:strand:+ start:4653 stop:5387 length:735 start_codon:yes stop_codon:yes gene_type:complete